MYTKFFHTNLLKSRPSVDLFGDAHFMWESVIAIFTAVFTIRTEGDPCEKMGSSFYIATNDNNILYKNSSGASAQNSYD